MWYIIIGLCYRIQTYITEEWSRTASYDAHVIRISHCEGLCAWCYGRYVISPTFSHVCVVPLAHAGDSLKKSVDVKAMYIGSPNSDSSFSSQNVLCFVQVQLCRPNCRWWIFMSEGCLLSTGPLMITQATQTPNVLKTSNKSVLSSERC